MPLMVKLSFLVDLRIVAVPVEAKSPQESHPSVPFTPLQPGLVLGCPGWPFTHLTVLAVIGLIDELPTQPAPPRVSDDTVVWVDLTPVPTCPFDEIPGGANVTVALIVHVTAGSGGPTTAPATPPVAPTTATALMGMAIAAATTSILRTMCIPFPHVSMGF
jgi:hypothetical protein